MNIAARLLIISIMKWKIQTFAEKVNVLMNNNLIRFSSGQ